MRPLNRSTELSAQVLGVEETPTASGYVEVRLRTGRGAVTCRFYESSRSAKCAVMVGGVGGDFDTPAGGLYPTLARELVEKGVSSLRVQFRHPTDLEESAMDVLAGLRYLRSKGIQSAALIGHSLGGAVVVQAAATDPMVRVVVTLSTQSYGIDPLSDLEPGVATLIIHGREDPILPFSSSIHAYALAKEPKKLILIDGAGHTLDEAPKLVLDEVRTWLMGNLFP